MHKIILLAFIVLFVMLARELWVFAVLFSNGDEMYGIGPMMWFAELQAKILFLYLLASRVDAFVNVVQGILWQAAYRSFKIRRNRENDE